MSRKKEVIVLKANGERIVLPTAPTLKQMQDIVGGYVEHVTVLDFVDEHGHPYYASMYVNDSGLIDGLARNVAATEVYQRNVRTAYPGDPAPFQTAKKDYLKSMGQQDFTADLTPPAAKAGGYEDDPWIAGDAILFSGYTRQEADEAVTKARSVA